MRQEKNKRRERRKSEMSFPWQKTGNDEEERERDVSEVERGRSERERVRCGE